MKVILMQAVPGLGEAGTVKEVADGYARNYLLPKKLAVIATRGSLKQAEAQAQLYARRASKAMSASEQSAATIEGKTIKIRARVGSENRLYGSITPADVAEALHVQYGVEIDRRRVAIDEAIHRVGTYGASAEFGQGVAARFNIEIAPEATGAHGKATRAAGEQQPHAEAETQAEPEVAAEEETEA